MKYFSASTTRSPRELRITILASSATIAGAESDGLTATQRSAPRMACSRLMARRRVRVAHIPAGAIAGKAAAVIPAARILRNVAADGALIANLRRRGRLGGFAQNSVLLLHGGIADHVGQRGHGADLEAAIPVSDTRKFLDLAQIDDDFRALDAVLEPVKAVQAARQHPGVRAVLPRAARPHRPPTRAGKARRPASHRE